MILVAGLTPMVAVADESLRESLDKALARTPSPSVGGMIKCSFGLQFAPGSAELQAATIPALRKLGKFMQEKPRLHFVVEGHTDSIGSAQHNQWLSEQRAKAAKDWLVNEMGIAPERLTIRGFGSRMLIVRADRSAQEQEPNRRVEFVVRRSVER